MKAILAVLAIAVVASAAYDAEAQFQTWASRFNKQYTKVEYSRRLAVFKNNMRLAEEMTALHGTATFGASRFADLTAQEFQETYLGTRPYTGARNVAAARKVEDVPAEFDWRTVNPPRINSIKDQQSCGSCWAFSAVAHLENWDAGVTGKLKLLSEQQVVDCDENCIDPSDPGSCDAGCNGGWMVTAMQYAVANGLEGSADYPYHGYDQSCKYDATKVIAKFTGTPTVLPKGDEASLLSYAATEGPISVAVNANPFQLYISGILTSNCPGKDSDLNHGVAVVGWGHDTKKDVDFWIIRNSWGRSWGEDGYIRIKRGVNLCGVAQDSTLLIKA